MSFQPRNRKSWRDFHTKLTTAHFYECETTGSITGLALVELNSQEWFESRIEISTPMKHNLAEPDPLPDRYAGKGSGQLTIPISFCKPHVAWGC